MTVAAVYLRVRRIVNLVAEPTGFNLHRDIFFLNFL